MGSLGDELRLGSMPISRNVMNVEKLEEEKKKIESCQLQLPLSLQILNNAISYLKDDHKRLKDFISLNKPFQQEDEEIDMQLLKRAELMREKKKFHQWQSNDHISNTKNQNKLETESNEEKSCMLLRNPKVETCLGLGLTPSSIVNGEGSSCGFTSNSMPQPPRFLQQQALRKQRRCWTPELHRRFVDALQQLGGPGVATPKQIRERMQEEGLTNDEVKSHLQKYRLHIRKPNSNPEKQSVVGLGFKLWNSSQDDGEESSSLKRVDSKSDSPQGPLQLQCTTGGDSSMEDAEDESFQMERC